MFYWWKSISLFWSKRCYLAVVRARQTRFAPGAWDGLGFWMRRLVPVLLWIHWISLFQLTAAKWYRLGTSQSLIQFPECCRMYLILRKLSLSALIKDKNFWIVQMEKQGGDGCKCVHAFSLLGLETCWITFPHDLKKTKTLWHIAIGRAYLWIALFDGCSLRTKLTLSEQALCCATLAASIQSNPSPFCPAISTAAAQKWT